MARLPPHVYRLLLQASHSAACLSTRRFLSKTLPSAGNAAVTSNEQLIHDKAVKWQQQRSVATSSTVGQTPCPLPTAFHTKVEGPITQLNCTAFRRAFSTTDHMSNRTGSQDAAAKTQQQPATPEVIRHRILEAAVRHVPHHGWSTAALAAAAVDLGYSPAAAGLVQEGATGLVQYFVDQCNSRLTLELQRLAPEFDGMRVRDKVVTGVKLRLQMLRPYIGSWPQAMALLSQPSVLPHTLVQVGTAVDDIWRAAGDASTDSSWYTKRALLAGVYTATELYMLTDASPDFEDTWTSLQQRVDDVVAAGKQLQQVGRQLDHILHAGKDVLSQVLHRFPQNAPQT